MDWAAFKEKVSIILIEYEDEYQIAYYDDKITFNIRNKRFEYTKEDYENLLSKVDNYVYNSFVLNKKEEYEAVIYEPKSNALGYDRILGETTVSNFDTNTSLKVDIISNEMLYFIIKNLDLNKYTGAFSLRYYKKSLIKDLDLWKLLKFAMYNPYSIVVASKSEISEDEFTNLVNAYFFDVSLSSGDLFKIANRPYHVLGPEIRLESAYLFKGDSYIYNKIYNKDLLNQYNIASMANDPMLQFIAYYHIMEYFFDIVYDSDTFDTIENAITVNDASVKNEDAAKKILNILKSKYNINRDSKEREKLRLTLKEYVTPSELCKSIELNHKELIKDYKDREVTFSKGGRVNLKGDNDKDIYNDLADRIYKTRNAIVHSKANNEGELEDIYKPFEHEDALKKEIPLMKAIAEQIIIKTAEEI